MKVLSIGNSFSQDAHKWLYDVCKSGDEEIYNVNLYIGGCSLETHRKNFCGDEPAYDYEIKGEAVKKITLKEAILSENWDVITFQQASYCSGMYDTFEPFLSDLYREIKSICTSAKFYIHKTWSYETDCTLDGFKLYNNDQNAMYLSLSEAYRKAAESIGAEIIPTGDVIQYLRDNTKEFNYGNGGISLCRDGFHLSYDYGRYAAALTWYCKLFGKSACEVEFVPNQDRKTVDEKLITIIKNAVDDVLNERA